MIPKILATIIQSSNKDATIEEFFKLHHNSVNEDTQIAHKFLRDNFSSHITLLNNLLMRAMPEESVRSLISPEGFQSLLAMLGTNAQGIGTSAISQWTFKCSELSLSEDDRKKLDEFIDKLYEDLDSHSGTFLNNEGVGLFSLQSSCNHSCLPNAEPSYLHNNSRLSLVALNDIKEGDEICISYLDECTLQRSKHSRNKELSDNYLFVCQCLRCQEQITDADITSEEDDGDDD